MFAGTTVLSGPATPVVLNVVTRRASTPTPRRKIYASAGGASSHVCGDGQLLSDFTTVLAMYVYEHPARNMPYTTPRTRGA